MAKDQKGKAPAAQVAAGVDSPPAPPVTRTVRVRAVRTGFHGNERKKPGSDPFDITLEGEAELPTWVVEVKPGEAPPETRAPARPTPITLSELGRKIGPPSGTAEVII